MINTDWEYLDSGTPEERACFAALGVYAQRHCLTEGRDALANRLRRAPYLSAFALAEWFAWNWWRLRWEPRGHGLEWALAHHISSIGGGYIWPDITVFADGERAALVARATPERPETPFRYIGNVAVVMPAAELEVGIENFIGQVLDRLDSEQVPDTNLARIWQDVQRERSDPALTTRRKLEALLGHDPNEADTDIVDQLEADARQWGQGAAQELAANAGHATPSMRRPPSAHALKDMAKHFGFDRQPENVVRLAKPCTQSSRAQTPAWQQGADAAHALRVQETLGVAPLRDSVLAAMLGTGVEALKPCHANSVDFAFALDSLPRTSRVVLRSRWHTGRRFEMARLLGDRLTADVGNSLFLATATDTYQQKLQRAFAAELLSPFEAVLPMLEGDLSDDKLQEVADHFQVSELTLRTQLVNHDVLERDELDHEFLAVANYP